MTSPVRVLVVEDDPDYTAFIRDYLIAHDYDVETLEYSREALDILVEEEGAYDLLILDVMLVGLDGVTLTKRLRQAGIMTPVLLVSGGVDPALRLSIATMGPSVSFLEKGSQKELLLTSCTDLLAQNHLMTMVTKLSTKMDALFDERSGSALDLSDSMAMKLETHCPVLHEQVLAASAVKCEEEAAAKMQAASVELHAAIEEATDVPKLFSKAKEHSMVRTITFLMGVIFSCYICFAGYSFSLANKNTQEVIQIKADVKSLGQKFDTSMAKNSQQMTRIERKLATLSPSPPASGSTQAPQVIPTSTGATRP